MNSTPSPIASSNGKAKLENTTQQQSESAQQAQTIRRAVRNTAELAKRAEIETALQAEMKDGIHYLATPTKGDNKDEKRYTLLKPGAEYLMERLGLCARVHPSTIIPMVRDFDHGYISITATGVVYAIAPDGRELTIAEMDGSCNSYEPRYRYIMAEPTCPHCSAPSVFRSKNDGEGFFCWKKKGGCGATFSANDKAITSQKAGRVENPDVMAAENTILKMAEKRALIAAVLVATNMSKHFTQDLEDHLPPRDDRPAARSQPAKPTPPPQRGAPQPPADTSQQRKDSPIRTAAVNALMTTAADYKKAMELKTTPSAIANHTLVRVAQLQHVEPVKIEHASIDAIKAATLMLREQLANGKDTTPAS